MASDFVRGLKCRLCGQTYPKEPLNFCTEDFGPLEVGHTGCVRLVYQTVNGLEPRSGLH